MSTHMRTGPEYEHACYIYTESVLMFVDNLNVIEVIIPPEYPRYF